MYKQIAPSVVKEMRDMGIITLTIKKGWEEYMQWHAIPYHINFSAPHNTMLKIGSSITHIFNCYVDGHGSVMNVSNVAPSKEMSKNKSLIDVYLHLAIKHAVAYAEDLGKTKLTFSSKIPSAAEHLVDCGFRVFPVAGMEPVYMNGYLDIKE